MVPCPRVVLDTNAWLDLLVFRDPRMHALESARAGGRILYVLAASGLAELERVLGYDALALGAAAGRRVLDAARSIAVIVTPGPPPADLPRCRDPDDQPFLELAAAANARWLVTRDAQLLRLAPRTRRKHGFDILTPEAWARAAAG